MPTWFLVVIFMASMLSGALSVFVGPLWLRQLREWRCKRAQMRPIRPAMRGALYARQLRLARKIEAYGRESCDVEMELLGLVLTHATYQVHPGHGFPEFRLNVLRDTADIAARHVIDKWWRPRKVHSTDRVREMLRRVTRDRLDSDGAS